MEKETKMEFGKEIVRDPLFARLIVWLIETDGNMDLMFQGRCGLGAETAPQTASDGRSAAATDHQKVRIDKKKKQ